MADREIIATDLFDGGQYCSQAVLGTFCEDYDMETDMAFKISCGLNSGCRSAELCGAVSGAILVIGLKYGDSSELCNSKTEKFIKAFRDENGSIVCRDILGCDITVGAGREKAIAENLFGTICRDMVASAVRILEKQGY